jgi:hypothetical protein
MRKTIYSLCLAFMLVGSAKAQSPDWIWARNSNPGTSAIVESYDVANDSYGNVFITGAFAGDTLIIGNTILTGVSDYDFFVAKFDSSGNALWAKNAGGPDREWGMEIATAPDGSVAVAGNFLSDTILWENDTLLLNDTLVQSSDIFVVKYDTDGNLMWLRSSGEIGMDRAEGIAIDTFGNILVTGEFRSDTMVFGDTSLVLDCCSGVFIVKYDPSGNVLWARNENGSTYQGGSDIATDSDGNVLITGSYISPVFTIGTTVLENTTSNWKFFVAKFDPDGNPLWATNSDQTGLQLSKGITADTMGNVIVSGLFAGRMVFEDDTLSTTGGRASFLIKYDSNGTYLWSRQSVSSADAVAEDVTCNLNGDVFLTGSFGNSIIWFGDILLTNPGFNNSFVVKYGSDGTEQWAKRIGASSGYTNGYGISADAFNSIYLTGYFNAPALTFGNTTLTSVSEDLYLAKLQSEVYCSSSFYNPIITASGSLTFCDGATILLDAGSGYDEYLWSTGESTQTISVDTTDDYWVEVRVDTCWHYSDTLPLVMNIVEVPVSQNGALLTSISVFVSYQWYLNGEPIVNATNQTYCAQEFGNYYVVVIDEYGCIGTSLIIELASEDTECGIGINEPENNFTIYPNPTTTHITIEMNSQYRTSNIECRIMNTMGQVVFHSTFDIHYSTFDISFLTPGLYLLQVFDNKGALVKVEKVVKE